MLIGEVADHLGTSPRSLRYYEQKGLMAPSRGPSGYRIYGRADVVRAGNIRDLLALGLTISDVREYLAEGCLDEPLAGEQSCSEEIPTVQRRMKSLDGLIDRLRTERDQLAEYSRRLECRALSQ